MSERIPAYFNVYLKEKREREAVEGTIITMVEKSAIGKVLSAHQREGKLYFWCEFPCTRLFISERLDRPQLKLTQYGTEFLDVREDEIIMIGWRAISHTEHFN